MIRNTQTEEEFPNTASPKNKIKTDQCHLFMAPRGNWFSICTLLVHCLFASCPSMLLTFAVQLETPCPVHLYGQTLELLPLFHFFQCLIWECFPLSLYLERVMYILIKSPWAMFLSPTIPGIICIILEGFPDLLQQIHFFDWKGSSVHLSKSLKQSGVEFSFLCNKEIAVNGPYMFPSTLKFCDSVIVVLNTWEKAELLF